MDGRVALVTGASKGIGAAIAHRFAEAGAALMLTSRKIEPLEAAAEAIRAAVPGASVAVVAANGGDVEAGRAVVAATVERFGSLDVLVNNAATNPYQGPVLGVDEGRFDKTVQVNLRGPVFWTKAVWEQWQREHGGVVVNIASVGGVRPEPTLGVYNLTKAALVHLTRQLASELAPQVRVVGVAPGLVRTDFARTLIEAFGDTLTRRIPARRLGEPDDIARLVTFLASDAASWITGETVVIDGGAGVSAGF